MTKPRAPLSLDAALARIAGQVDGSWDAMAAHVGYAARTVRKWGDEDADDHINLPAAIQLDFLHQQHGGEGWPLYEAYGLMLGVAAAARFVDQFEILRRVIDVARETGEAEAALIRCALPDADADDRRSATREVLEAVDALKDVLPLLNPLAGGLPGRPAPEEHSRAPP